MVIQSSNKMGFIWQLAWFVDTRVLSYF